MIRFLVNAYEIVIVLMLIISTCTYGAGLLYVGYIMNNSLELDSGIGLIISLGMAASLTVAFAVVVALLGASAVLVDIRNIQLKAHPIKVRRR